MAVQAEVVPSCVIDPVETVMGWLRGRDALEKRFIERARANPLESLAVMLIGGSLVFMAAEKPVNNKVNTFWDALYFISTCASVGYADIVAKTNVGKAVGALVMSFGPALCAMALDRPDIPPMGSDMEPRTDLTPLLAKMDAMLAELQRIGRVSLPG
ncbi:MAG: two pore domain potassium channel family protein [Armatimonadetes bacterium]|nr:two pore domain potassium channel family protein [Armatimonadota bacterium]